MTDENNKAKVAFYIFTQDEKGESQRVGTAFNHKKGNGVNIVIGKTRYIAFPPKPKG